MHQTIRKNSTWWHHGRSGVVTYLQLIPKTWTWAWSTVCGSNKAPLNTWVQVVVSQSATTNFWNPTIVTPSKSNLLKKKKHPEPVRNSQMLLKKKNISQPSTPTFRKVSSVFHATLFSDHNRHCQKSVPDWAQHKIRDETPLLLIEDSETSGAIKV